MSARNKHEPLALSIADTCGMLGVGKTFLKGEIAAGRLRAVKAGDRTLIPIEAAQAWLAALPPAVPSEQKNDAGDERRKGT